MPTTTKGLPYPVSTAAPNVPLDLQTLAEALDFSKVQLITGTANVPGGSTSLITVYPYGVSILALNGAESSGGGWPSASTLSVLTIRSSAGGATAQQFAFRASTTDPRVWFRLMSTAANSAWMLLTAWTTSVTLPDIAAGGVQSAAVTFPATTFTGTPIVAASPAGSSFLTAGCSSVPTSTGVTVYARSTATGVVAAPRVLVTANGVF